MGESGAILLAAYGLLLGARHALEPDHLAAVSTMSAHGSSRSDVLRVSAAWGAGHATIVIIAGILLAAIPHDVSRWLTVRAETLVGLALVAVGIWTFAGVRRHDLHIHQHIHGTDPPHTHFHLHRHTADHARHAPPLRWIRRPLVAYLVGTLHGLAGSGAASALAALAAPSRTALLVYLVCFGGGALLGMLAVGILAVWPVLRFSGRVPRMRPLVQGLAGIASVAIGLVQIAAVR